MASTSETGFAKNTANFDQLISIILGLGTTYNPSKAALKIATMQALSSSAKTSVTAANTALQTEKLARKSRLTAFNAVNPLATKVLNALIATDSTTQVDELAKSIVRTIRGTRVSEKLTPEQKTAAEALGKSIKEISTSHKSFDIIIDNFEKLIKLVSGIPEYIPNEAELKVTALTTFHTDLKAKNKAVIAAITVTENARIDRHNYIDKDLTGLVDIALDAKTYIKSVYGSTSLQYKQVSKLRFTKIM